MLTYFLQVNVCWLLFYSAYYALLSKETFFRLNRIWLITSLLCGLALPSIADYFAIKVAPTNFVALTLQPFVVTAKGFQQDLAADTEGVVLRVLALAYTLGVVVLAVRFLAGLVLIFRLYRQSKKETKGGFTHVYTEGVCHLFLFSILFLSIHLILNWLIINKLCSTNWRTFGNDIRLMWFLWNLSMLCFGAVRWFIFIKNRCEMYTNIWRMRRCFAPMQPLSTDGFYCVNNSRTSPCC